MPSLKKNFIYNAILTMSGYIFPLMVYPYVSRILGVANMGACNFVDSIVEYFTIISMMGMNILGIREIAKNRDNKENLSKTFSQLFSLNTITTVIAIICLLMATFMVPKFAAYRDLLYIGIGKLFFNYLLINWFFQGLENFKYITARYIFVKMLFVISVFLFVRTESDVKLYYLLVALTWAGNGIINYLYARRLVSFHFTFKIPKSIISSYLILGFYWLMNSMYSTLNTAFLGFETNDVEVGYYTTANKLLMVIMAAIISFNSVLVPRISNSLSSNSSKDYEDAKELIHKAMDALILFSIPIIIFVFIFSPDLIYLMSGKEYEGAIVPLKIMTPLFFLYGYDQIIVLQTLLPLGKERTILRNSAMAATVGILSNLVLTSTYGKLGASIVLLLAEMTVLITSQLCATRYMDLRFPFASLAKHAIAFLPIIFICYTAKYFIASFVINMIVAAALTGIYLYVAGKYLVKNKIFINNFRKLS